MEDSLEFISSLKTQIDNFLEEHPEPTPDPDPVPEPPVIGRMVATSISDLLDKIKALPSGDATIGMANGNYGSLTLSNINIGGELNIVSENRRAANFEKIVIDKNSKDIRLTSMGVCPVGEFTSTIGLNNKFYGVTSDGTTSMIDIEDFYLQGHEDSANHLSWSLQDWRNRGLGAVFLQGANSSIRNCFAQGVRFGFNLIGANSLCENNFVDGASGDGFRASQDFITFMKNVAKNLVYMKDGNHPDGFQAFGKVVAGKATLLSGLSISGLALIEWEGNNPSSLHWNDNLNKWGIMQGVGLHATAFKDLILNDIFVVTAVSNGIHIGGCQNLTGSNWEVRSPLYGTPDFDTRFPKINVNAGGSVSVDNISAEAFAGNLVASNKTSPDYSKPAPSWIDDVIASVK